MTWWYVGTILQTRSLTQAFQEPVTAAVPLQEQEEVQEPTQEEISLQRQAEALQVKVGRVRERRKDGKRKEKKDG